MSHREKKKISQGAHMCACLLQLSICILAF